MFVESTKEGVPTTDTLQLSTYVKMNKHNKKLVDLYSDHTELFVSPYESVYSCQTSIVFNSFWTAALYAYYRCTELYSNDVDIALSPVANFSCDPGNELYYRRVRFLRSIHFWSQGVLLHLVYYQALTEHVDSIDDHFRRGGYHSCGTTV